MHLYEYTIIYLSFLPLENMECSPIVEIVLRRRFGGYYKQYRIVHFGHILVHIYSISLGFILIIESQVSMCLALVDIAG